MEETKELEQLATPIVNYLRTKGYGHPTVVITDNRIILMTDKISIPVPYTETELTPYLNAED